MTRLALRPENVVPLPRETMAPLEALSFLRGVDFGHARGLAEGYARAEAERWRINWPLVAALALCGAFWLSVGASLGRVFS